MQFLYEEVGEIIPAKFVPNPALSPPAEHHAQSHSIREALYMDRGSLVIVETSGLNHSATHKAPFLPTQHHLSFIEPTFGH